MIINMLTTARRPLLYVHRMITSLVASNWQGQVNFIAGSEDNDYLVRYFPNPNYTLVPWTGPLFSQRENCSLNHLRALKYGDGPCLIVEDDLLFLPGWYELLMGAVAKIPPRDFVLDADKGNRKLLIPNRIYPKNLQGAQALYYSTGEVRSRCADYFEKNRKRACADNVIGFFAVNEAELWQANSPIVQHIGQVSTFHFREAAGTSR